LTKKRAGITQGLPPGKEDLAWVTHTVTLIYGERDVALVDTFLSVQHSKELVNLAPAEIRVEEPGAAVLDERQAPIVGQHRGRICILAASRHGQNYLASDGKCAR